MLQVSVPATYSITKKKAKQVFCLDILFHTLSLAGIQGLKYCQGRGRNARSRHNFRKCLSIYDKYH